mmetsp:Transcript_32369/g.68074  ORF Transcript_32369/g.68074 Transcript_32369/m.68074 type:complete len:214 (+) Transcript_32369:144-785(+)
MVAHISNWPVQLQLDTLVAVPACQGHVQFHTPMAVSVALHACAASTTMVISTHIVSSVYRLVLRHLKSGLPTVQRPARSTRTCARRRTRQSGSASWCERSRCSPTASSARRSILRTRSVRPRSVRRGRGTTSRSLCASDPQAAGASTSRSRPRPRSDGGSGGARCSSRRSSGTTFRSRRRSVRRSAQPSSPLSRLPSKASSRERIRRAGLSLR